MSNRFDGCSSGKFTSAQATLDKPCGASSATQRVAFGGFRAKQFAWVFIKIYMLNMLKMR